MKSGWGSIASDERNMTQRVRPPCVQVLSMHRAGSHEAAALQRSKHRPHELWSNLLMYRLEGLRQEFNLDKSLMYTALNSSCRGSLTTEHCDMDPCGESAAWGDTGLKARLSSISDFTWQQPGRYITKHG